MPLGRPINNTRCYVLDAQLQPVPIGARADLYVGGDGLARGYCNRPALTAECFRDDPFLTNHDARLYKSGDRARYLPDGNLEYLGRTDHQVKVRGFRIELREIEAVLSLHPQVATAAATVQEGMAQDKHLVAYIVGQRGETSLTAKALRDFLTQKLPGYMVPAEFVILDSLPLTSSGKLDRRALRAKNPSRHAMNRYVPPEDPVEWQLVKIWEELLDIRPIGIADNFFDLGGHSLFAIRMMDRIEQAYGKRLPLSTLFADASVLHLADCLRLESVREWGSPIVPVQPEGSRPPFFYLHGDLGGGLYCRTLAQLLGSDQPLYGVMPSGVDGKPFLPTVEAMAKENIRHLLAVQHEGPYLLGGYCNGGVVAYEMAQQLHRQGREVGMLILLDTWVPRYFGWLKAIVQNTRGPSRPDADRRAQVYIRLRNYLVRTHWAYHQGPRVLLSLYLQKARRVIWQSLRSSDQEFGRIISSYRPQPYPGRVILLRTRYLEESYPTDRTAGWGRLARNLEIQELPGDHHNCLTEHLGDVAEHIRRWLIGYPQTTDMELAENSRC